MKPHAHIISLVREGVIRHPGKTYIYLFLEPATQRVRYVGKSVQPLRRFEQHSSHYGADKNYPVSRWIDKLSMSGLVPKMLLIECVPDEKQATREIYWIAFYRNLYPDLLNITEGGDGMLGVISSPETRARVGVASAAAWAKLTEAERIARITKMHAAISYAGDFGKHVSASKRGKKPVTNNAGSKFTGVTKGGSNWLVSINIGVNARKYLGSFNTEIGAASAYNREARVLGLPLNDIPGGEILEAPGVNQGHLGQMMEGRTSKYPGVSWNNRKQRWMAQFTYQQKRHIVGQYLTEELAYAAYQKALGEAAGNLNKMEK